jgi:radical SAM superfamily enzyme YgiQ (UPF0313 family)
LTAHGHDSSILLIPKVTDANLQAALLYVVEARPGAVGFSTMSYEFAKTKDFARSVRAALPGTPLIFGGIHPTSDPEDCLDVADFVVRGEGEETLAELLPILAGEVSGDYEDVAGLVIKCDGNAVYAPVRQPVQDLDALPFPGHLPEGMFVIHRGQVRSVQEKAIYKTYGRYQGTFPSILTSRGCPYSCTYCCNSVFQSLYGRLKIRTRSPENVIAELEQLVRDFKNISYINFADDCFTVHPLPWLERFRELYTERIGLPFVARATPRHVTREKLTVLRKAGLHWMLMGLQTGSDRINREIYDRHTTAEDFIETAQVASDLKLAAWYDVITDNPYETEEDQLETIEVLLRTPRPFQVAFFSLDFFPGTELKRRALADGVPVPELGTKSYMEPEPTVINRCLRMGGTFPRFLTRFIVKNRHNAMGAVVCRISYAAGLLAEPVMYVYLTHRANNMGAWRTVKVVYSFCVEAAKKLLFKIQG